MHTDYALRIMLHAAAQDGVRLSISDVAAKHGISRNHLMKVVNHLASAGLLNTVRGRGGGFSLGRDAAEIRLGDIVRLTEPNLRPADCANCLMQQGCGLTGILAEAVAGFLDVLDRKTLADAVAESKLDLARFLPDRESA